MFRLSPLLILAIICLLSQVINSIDHNPYREPLWVQYRHDPRGMENIDERYVEYAEEFEDDDDINYRVKRNIDEYEDPLMDGEEDEELVEARKALGVIQKQISQRAIINATTDGTTVVELNNSYCFLSHDTFGIERYPNEIKRSWVFIRGVDVFCLKVHCWFFRIEWANCCQYDKFSIFMKPYIMGRRFCGQIHGFWKVYYRDIKITWKADRNVRKAGFSCEVTGMPEPVNDCCAIVPEEPDTRQSVSSCADLLPGYDYCQCTDIGAGQICLQCSICETCQMEFFAVHDFSPVGLYIHFEFPCDNCTMDLSSLTFGFEQHVSGFVNCLIPYPHVTLPTYPSAELTIGLFCPIDTNILDICNYFQTLIAIQTGKRSHVALDVNHSPKAKRTLGSLVILANDASTDYTSNALSSIPQPENYINIYINDTLCKLFSPSQSMDLSAFTQAQYIEIDLCDTTLPCGSIIIDSMDINEVNIRLPDVAKCNNNIGCVVNNQAIPPAAAVVSCKQL